LAIGPMVRHSVLCIGPVAKELPIVILANEIKPIGFNLEPDLGRTR